MSKASLTPSEVSGEHVTVSMFAPNVSEHDSVASVSAQAGFSFWPGSNCFLKKSVIIEERRQLSGNKGI